MASKPGMTEQLSALLAWKDSAADPALRQVEQFAYKVGMTLQDIVKKLEKLEARLEALAAIQGLAWQSGWLPSSKSDGKSEGAPVIAGFDMREHMTKVPEGAVPMLKGGYVYPTYL